VHTIWQTPDPAPDVFTSPKQSGRLGGTDMDYALQKTYLNSAIFEFLLVILQFLESIEKFEEPRFDWAAAVLNQYNRPLIR